MIVPVVVRVPARVLRHLAELGENPRDAIARLWNTLAGVTSAALATAKSEHDKTERLRKQARTELDRAERRLRAARAIAQDMDRERTRLRAEYVKTRAEATALAVNLAGARRAMTRASVN